MKSAGVDVQPVPGLKVSPDTPVYYDNRNQGGGGGGGGGGGWRERERERERQTDRQTQKSQIFGPAAFLGGND